MGQNHLAKVLAKSRHERCPPVYPHEAGERHQFLSTARLKRADAVAATEKALLRIFSSKGGARKDAASITAPGD
jgi:hypothetical protein